MTETGRSEGTSSLRIEAGQASPCDRWVRVQWGLTVGEERPEEVWNGDGAAGILNL